MTARRLNICLHDIVSDTSQIGSIYDLTTTQLNDLLAILIDLQERGVLSTYDIFFDDGYRSFRQISEDFSFGVANAQIHSAIITELIGTEGKLAENDISWLKRRGFSIDTHGVSHAALAVFEGSRLQDTPEDGQYQNKPYGKDSVLSEQEVLFQLKESAATLRGMDVSPSGFVLPYGLYNSSTVLLAAGFTDYDRMFTCDAAFDCGQFLAPRLLVTQENIEDIEAVIMSLDSEIILLTKKG